MNKIAEWRCGEYLEIDIASDFRVQLLTQVHFPSMSNYYERAFCKHAC